MTFHFFFSSDLWPSVLTPYFKEDVLYSEDELKKENEDGISTLFYLQKIYLVSFNFIAMLYFLLYDSCELRTAYLVTN